MEDLKVLLDYIVVPLLYVLYRFNQRITILEHTQITKQDIKELYNKLDEIQKEIHSKAENYVHRDSCTSCKK